MGAATNFLHHICIFRVIHHYLWDTVFENKPDTCFALNTWYAPTSSVRIWWASQSSSKYSRNPSPEPWHWRLLYLLASLMMWLCPAAAYWWWHSLFTSALLFKVRQNRKTRQLRDGKGKEASCSWTQKPQYSWQIQSSLWKLCLLPKTASSKNGKTDCAHLGPWVYLWQHLFSFLNLNNTPHETILQFPLPREIL